MATGYTTHAVQPRMEYGFKDFNGNTWPDSWVDSYNRYTDDINLSAGRALSTDSLTQRARDTLLDNRHRFFVVCLKAS